MEEVCPHLLGIMRPGDEKMDILNPRNKLVPYEVARFFETKEENAKKFEV